MKVVSKTYSPIFLKFPVLRWIGLLIQIPFLLIIYFFIPVMLILSLGNDNNSIWITCAVLVVASYIIPYINVNKGWGHKQIIELNNCELIVKTTWFLLTSKKKYPVDNLEIKDLEPWNYLTGKPIALPSEYCRLLINEETTLPHIYSKEELNNLIKRCASLC